MSTRFFGPRYEIKLPLPIELSPWLKGWLHTSRAHWRQAYPPRWVNSLYFDDEQNSAMTANLEGQGKRRKVRLRWYGATLAQIEGAALEVKAREGRVGTKRVHRLPHLCCDLTRLAWPDLLRELTRSPEAREPLLRYPRPTLIVRYLRHYYVSATTRIRLTLDERVMVFDQRTSRRPNVRRAFPPRPRVIVELKADPADADALRAFLDELPARPTRHSKYVLGRLQVLGGGYDD